MTTTSTGTPRAALMERLVNRTGGVRSEATIQSDVRMLLLDPELGLAEDDLDVQLEAQVGKGRRIDVEVGCTVIEVKKSLHSPAVVAPAVEQLTDYVETRSEEMGQRYVGILTDGKLWIVFHEVDGHLTITLDRPDSPRITRALTLLTQELSATPTSLPGDRRPLAYQVNPA